MLSGTERRPLPRSLYADTARSAPAEAVLNGDLTTEVVIVGGGFTGLSTALHLAEAGVSAVVLEANEPGWGASGRNGGQVNPGLKWTPDQLEAAFGSELGGRMVRMGGEAPDLVFDLIARHGIACEPVRGGTIRAAGGRKSEAGIRDFQAQWQSRGVDITLLDRAGMESEVGTDAYALGCIDRRGGNLNPLGYARGLAEAALKAGGQIFSSTRALKLTRSNGRWQVVTPRGTVTATRVVLATNGYSDDLWPGLRRSIVPVYSSIAATAPLSPNLAASIMPNRPSLYEMSATYAYYRVDAHNRLLMGGRSVMRDSGNFSDYRTLIAYAEKLFPAIEGIEWTHCWNGQVAITPDSLPHVHEPADGLHIGLGYNGRGVAMATAMGRMLARRAAGGSAEELDLPVTRISPMFGHFAWPLAVKARLVWETFRERAGV